MKENKDKNKNIYIGVDVAKYKLDIYISETGEYQTIENKKESILIFINYIKNDLKLKEKDIYLIIDLTGGYEYKFKNICYENNLKNIILAEGRKVKNFSRSLKHYKAKTDKIDSYILSEYARTFIKDLEIYNPISENRLKIKQIHSRILDLKELKAIEKNRYSSPCENIKIKESIKQHIDLLENQIDTLQEEIDTIIQNDKELTTLKNLLIKEKGIKTEIAHLLIAELPELGKVDRRQIAGITGTAPIPRDSGTIKGYRITAGGRRTIKKYLFICVISQIRYNEEYKNKMEEMIKRGKKKKQVIVAIMRKIIVRLNAKVRDEFIKNDLF